MISVISVRNLSNSQLQNVVYVGRKCSHFAKSPLHNPFKLLQGDPKGATIARFRAYLWAKIQEQDRAICLELARLATLHKNGEALTLGCWCKLQPNDNTPCHADVIKSCIEWIANNPTVYNHLQSVLNVPAHSDF